MLACYDSFGGESMLPEDFCWRLTEIGDHLHLMSSFSSPTFGLSEYFMHKLTETVPLSIHEHGLCRFLMSYSPYLNDPPPESEFPLFRSIVLGHERVVCVVEELPEIDLFEALKHFDAFRYRDGWDTFGRTDVKGISDYFTDVFSFWRHAAVAGLAILHTQF